MKRAILACIVVLLFAVLACTSAPTALFSRIASAITATPSGPLATTPAFSALSLPTPLPTMGGPMGTLTAIAHLVASPEPNRIPYEIVYRGNPHFIEFHAWW